MLAAAAPPVDILVWDGAAIAEVIPGVIVALGDRMVAAGGDDATIGSCELGLEHAAMVATMMMEACRRRVLMPGTQCMKRAEAIATLAFGVL